MSLEPGDRIGDYEVVGILGAGGMGKVYKVRNFISNRVEAMKVLLPDLTGNREIAERFLREIRVLASLDHPNIAELRTAQRADRQVLMIMELIEGQSLDALLRRGPIPKAQMLSILDQVLSALEYAHQRGIVHRDIKPSNIMVTAAGAVKLMDFGIAKLKADRQLTAAGTTLGSLYYMSPEQIQGAADVDARSDLYSLGICMYEMATGTKPFDAGSEFSLMSAHLNEAPRPPAQIDASIPESLSQVILKALAKDRAQRFQSAREMSDALSAVKGEVIAAVVDGPGIAAAPAGAAKPAYVKAQSPLPSAPATARPAGTSRRMLWVTAGALATVAVLVAALTLAPRFTQTEAGNVPAKPVLREPKTAAPVDIPPVAPTKASDDAVVPSVPDRGGAGASAPLRQNPAQRAVRGGNPSAPLAAQQQQPGPQQQQPQTQTPMPTPSQTQAIPPAPPAGMSKPAETPASQAASAKSKVEMNAVREEYNQLAIRAATAKSGLQSLQNQMGGMGLRADMREAAARLDYLMQEAMTSLRAGDNENARRNLDLAERTAERIEKFLGR